MDSPAIYKTSKKLKDRIEWIKPSDTEWIYCGAGGEVKWDVLNETFIDFFEDKPVYIAVTRMNSFETQKADLLKNIETFVGQKDFLIWNEKFQKVIEFHKIGVFRKGIYTGKKNNESLKISYRKIKPGLPDKINGKLIKYRKGDCLSLNCGNGKFLGVLIVEKFNKYYDFTLIEYHENKEPTLADFINGRFFGSYGEGMNGIFTASERLMLPCLEVDANTMIEKVGTLPLIEELEKASYGGKKDIADIMEHYVANLQSRKQNSENFDKLPDQLFISDRLIAVKKIILPSMS